MLFRSVNLQQIVAPNARVRVSVNSKKYAEVGKFPYMSSAGVQGYRDPSTGFAQQDFLIHVNELPRMVVVGGNMANGVIRTNYDMGQVVVRPMALSSQLQYYRNINTPEIALRPKYASMYGGGIDNVSFFAENGNIGSIVAQAGHINASGAPTSILAQGNINLVHSSMRVYRRVRGAQRERIAQGGLLGSPDDDAALRIVSGAYGQIDPRLANIRALRGDLLVSGQFLAGSSDPDYEFGNWLGRVGRIVTRNAGQIPRNIDPPIPFEYPYIIGQSWSNRPIAFPSNANRSLFREN